jgi:hypothetical protein
MMKLKLCALDSCNKPVKRYDKYCSMHRARLTRTGRFDKKTPHERMMDRTKECPKSECIEYAGYVNKDGYGRLRAGGDKILAHRLSYEHNVGEIPEGLLVLHKCDNPSCVNPDHLFLGTDKDNHDDAIAKGRIDPSKRAKRRWKICTTLRKQV